MKAFEQEVLALLHAAHQERKEALDRGQVDTTFQVGDQVMLWTKEMLDAAEVGKLRPPRRKDAPDTYTLTLPARFMCRPTVNVGRLKPYFLRTGRPPSHGPVTDPGDPRQAGEYVLEQLRVFNRKTLRGRTYYLVRWQVHASAADSWEPAEHLANCPERVAEYAAAASRRPKALRAHPAACRSGAARAGGHPSRSAAPPLLRHRPSNPRPDGLWRPRARRTSARLRPSLLVASRGLARAHPAPMPAGGRVHPRRRLPDADRRLRGRGRHAPRSGHLP